jgi:hypothetical protein
MNQSQRFAGEDGYRDGGIGEGIARRFHGREPVSSSITRSDMVEEITSNNALIQKYPDRTTLFFIGTVPPDLPTALCLW